MSLIAKVMVRAWKDGERVDIEIGEEVPKGLLADHDRIQLLEMGAIEDTADLEKEKKADAKAQAKGDAEFQAARKAVKAADESIKDPEPSGEGA